MAGRKGLPEKQHCGTGVSPVESSATHRPRSRSRGQAWPHGAAKARLVRPRVPAVRGTHGAVSLAAQIGQSPPPPSASTPAPVKGPPAPPPKNPKTATTKPDGSFWTPQPRKKIPTMTQRSQPASKGRKADNSARTPKQANPAEGQAFQRLTTSGGNSAVECQLIPPSVSFQ